MTLSKGGCFILMSSFIRFGIPYTQARSKGQGEGVGHRAQGNGASCLYISYGRSFGEISLVQASRLGDHDHGVCVVRCLANYEVTKLEA
jgi:hypothetical protein